MTEQGYWMLAPGSVVRFMHASQAYRQDPADAYTVLRARFDPWFAQQAVDLGALVVPKTTVVALIEDADIDMGNRIRNARIALIRANQRRDLFAAACAVEQLERAVQEVRHD